MRPVLEELFPEVLSPAFVADELLQVSGVSAGLFFSYKLLRIVPLDEAVFAAVRQGMLAAAGIYIGWRLATGCVTRLVSALTTHRRRRRAALRRWQALGERIERLQKIAGAMRPEAAAAVPAAATQPTVAAALPSAPPAAALASADAGSGADSDSSGMGLGDLAGELTGGGDSGAAAAAGRSPSASPSPQPQPQRPATWGAGLAGWSQLYSRAAARAPPPPQPAAGEVGGSPVLLHRAQFEGGAGAGAGAGGAGSSTDDDDDWQRPEFGRAAAAR